MRTWARQDEGVEARVQRVDNARMGYLRTLLHSSGVGADDVEAVALLAFSLVIANQLIAADHPGQTRAQVMKKAEGLLFR
ncbi:MAG TPA: hypothetical protein VFW21_14910 [Mycobacterium sp.]|nr:hypothetical protein [Mycobacterium sp.]